MVLRALLVAVAAAPVYALARGLAEAAGVALLPSMLPLPWSLFEVWPVVPGAFAFALLVDVLVRRVAGAWRRLGCGAAAGALLGLLNAPLAVLVALLGFHLASPWKYGLQALLEEWLRQLPVILLLGIPVALPCGLILGLLAAWLATPARPWRT